eukprot:3925564-Rhodomonas_salina.1
MQFQTLRSRLSRSQVVPLFAGGRQVSADGSTVSSDRRGGHAMSGPDTGSAALRWRKSRRGSSTSTWSAVCAEPALRNVRAHRRTLGAHRRTLGT